MAPDEYRNNTNWPSPTRASSDIAADALADPDLYADDLAAVPLAPAALADVA